MDKKALGKGLAALISDKPEPLAITETNVARETPQPSEGVSYVKTDLINDNRLQPRVNYDEDKLDELKASIKEKGVLQPILVRQAGDGYEVIAGERRLRAVRSLGLDQVPVVIKNVTDREALVLALIENIQREELNAIEEAKGFKKLVEEFNFTQDDVAQSVGKDRSTITNLLRLLKLPQEIQQSVFDGALSVGHARALLSVDDKLRQKEIFDITLKKQLSVREVERLVKKPAGKGKSKKAEVDRDVLRLEEDLQRALGTKVKVETKTNQKGKVIIEYYSLDELDRIIGKLKA